MSVAVEPWGQEWRDADDATLLEQVRAGDSGAYAELWRRHLPAAYGVALRNRGRASAEDIVGEASLRVYGLLQAGKGPTSNFRAYFLSTVRSVAVDHARADLRVVPVVETDLDAMTDVVAGPDPSSIIDQELVRAAFRRLPERDQRVLWSTAVEGRSPGTIAGDLGMSANGVSVTALRARDNLRAGYLDAHADRAVERADTDECRWVMSQLGRFVRGKLTARQRARVDEHVRSCRHARVLADELHEVNRELPAVIVPLIFVAAAGSGAAWLGAASGGALSGAGADKPSPPPPPPAPLAAASNLSAVLGSVAGKVAALVVGVAMGAGVVVAPDGLPGLAGAGSGSGSASASAAGQSDRVDDAPAAGNDAEAGDVGEGSQGAGLGGDGVESADGASAADDGSGVVLGGGTFLGSGPGGARSGAGRGGTDGGDRESGNSGTGGGSGPSTPAQPATPPATPDTPPPTAPPATPTPSPTPPPTTTPPTTPPAGPVIAALSATVALGGTIDLDLTLATPTATLQIAGDPAFPLTLTPIAGQAGLTCSAEPTRVQCAVTAAAGSASVEALDAQSYDVSIRLRLDAVTPRTGGTVLGVTVTDANGVRATGEVDVEVPAVTPQPQVVGWPDATRLGVPLNATVRGNAGVASSLTISSTVPGLTFELDNDQTRQACAVAETLTCTFDDPLPFSVIPRGAADDLARVGQPRLTITVTNGYGRSVTHTAALFPPPSSAQPEITGMPDRLIAGGGVLAPFVSLGAELSGTLTITGNVELLRMTALRDGDNACRVVDAAGSIRCTVPAGGLAVRWRLDSYRSTSSSAPTLTVRLRTAGGVVLERTVSLSEGTVLAVRPETPPAGGVAVEAAAWPPARSARSTRG